MKKEERKTQQKQKKRVSVPVEDSIVARKVIKMAIEIEDDVFFADLSKQIALLITDDDEEEFPVQTPPVVHLQGFHHMPQAMMPPPPPYIYENYEIMAGYRRESKGTGVFIPRSSIPRRKNRSSGKSNSINNCSSQRQHDKSAGVAVSRATNINDRLQSNYYKTSASPNNRT